MIAPRLDATGRLPGAATDVQPEVGESWFTNGPEYLSHVTSVTGLAEHLSAYLTPGEPGNIDSPAVWLMQSSLTTKSADDQRGGTTVALEQGQTGILAGDPTGTRTILNLQTGSRITLDPVGRQVTVEGQTLKGLFTDCYRVIRQFLLWSQINRGALVLHAAAVADQSRHDQVSVYLGEKGSGKTTAAVFGMMRDSCTAYVANERVLLLPTRNGYSVAGWPLVVMVGLGTLRNIPFDRLQHLHIKAGGTAFMFQHALLDADRLQAISSGADAGGAAKVALTSREFALLCDADRVAAGPLSRILMPCAPQTWTDDIDECPSSELPAKLSDAIMNPFPLVSDWLGLRTISASTHEEMSRSIVSSLVHWSGKA